MFTDINGNTIGLRKVLPIKTKIIFCQEPIEITLKTMIYAKNLSYLKLGVFLTKSKAKHPLFTFQVDFFQNKNIIYMSPFSQNGLDISILSCGGKRITRSSFELMLLSILPHTSA